MHFLALVAFLFSFSAHSSDLCAKAVVGPREEVSVEEMDSRLNMLVGEDARALQVFEEFTIEIMTANAAHEGRLEYLFEQWSGAKEVFDAEISNLLILAPQDSEAFLGGLHLANLQFVAVLLHIREEIVAANAPVTASEVEISTIFEGMPPQDLKADFEYPYRNELSKTIHGVFFAQKPIDWLIDAPEEVSHEFMHGLSKGFVRETGDNGVKWLSQKYHVVEIKTHASNYRILGCFKAGILRLLTVIKKHSRTIHQDTYKHLCD